MRDVARCREEVSVMRFLNIPPFQQAIEIADFESFIRDRLSQKVVFWPKQAIPLVGYMGRPNDEDARATLISIVQNWSEESQAIPPGLGRTQKDWVRVADIFNIHYDLTAGGHQQQRGGPSVGKAITVAAGSIQTRGAHPANLWRAWATYKDVAHLVAAATIITAETRHIASGKQFGPLGFHPDDVYPFLIAMMMPDFVMSLGLSLQEYGLRITPQSYEEPMLDAETVWRISPDANVVAVPPPVRKIDQNAIRLLYYRRGGNRGKANHDMASALPVNAAMANSSAT
jgi:hypothetical protein